MDFLVIKSEEESDLEHVSEALGESVVSGLSLELVLYFLRISLCLGAVIFLLTVFGF